MKNYSGVPATLMIHLIQVIIYFPGTNTVIAQNVSEWSYPSWSNESTHLAFSSFDGNDWEIYTYDLSSEEVRQITNNTYDDSSPGWSPDGSQIIYESNRRGDVDIYNFSFKTGEDKILISTEMDDIQPAYSPNGQKILYVSKPQGDPQIFIMNMDNGTNHQLTFQGRNEMPNWSPNGKKVTFHSSWSGHWEIMTLNADGTAWTSPTHLPDEDFCGDKDARTGKFIGVPSYTPDGNSIIFHAAPEKISFGLYQIDLTTLEIAKIINEPENESFPRISPSAEWLAYRSNPNDVWGLYLMNLKSKAVKKVVSIENP